MNRFLLLLALLLLSPTAARSGDTELDLLGEQHKPAPDAPPPAEPTPTPAPAVDELREDLAAETDAGLRASALLQVALDRLVSAQLLLASGGGEPSAAMADLEAARQSLQAALVEVGRLREGADLKLWLLDGGLAVSSAPAPEPAPEPAVEVGPQPLPDAQFTAVVSAIEGVSFTRGKMELLRRELEATWVTSAQAGALVELFNFSRDRVDALVFLHPRVLDPENFVSLLSSLKFESDRENVRNQLGLDG